MHGTMNIKYKETVTTLYYNHTSNARNEGLF